MRAAILSTIALTASVASAHFQVLYPPQGQPFSDEEEATGPCGGPDPIIGDSTVDAPVDQFAISIRSSHPEGHWAFRATTATSPPYNFTDITPMVMTTGVGDFCLTMLSAPADFAGQSGIIQVVDIAEDGMLYQCTPVNFVEGANSTVGPACTNSSASFTAEYGSSDSTGGDSMGGMGDMTMSGTMSMEPTGSAAAAASSSVPDAAAAMATGVGALAGLGLAVAGLVL